MEKQRIFLFALLIVISTSINLLGDDITFTENGLIQNGDLYDYAYLYNGGMGQTTVEMIGGNIYRFVLYDDSHLIQSGGSASDGSSLFNVSHLYMSGGSAGGITVHDSSIFNFSGGVINNCTVSGDGIANLTGGKVLSWIRLEDNAILNISGGDFSNNPNITQYNNEGTVNIYYYSRAYEGGAYSGIFPDGLPFFFSSSFNYHQVDPSYVLTIQTEPNDANTVIQSVNRYDVQDECFFYNIIAEQFIYCPEVYRFDHWEGAGVLDPNLSNTEVSIISDKTITVVFVATRECGDECHPDDLFGDYNHDCIINVEDFAEFAFNWLVCTKPECD